MRNDEEYSFFQFMEYKPHLQVVSETLGCIFQWLSTEDEVDYTTEAVLSERKRCGLILENDVQWTRLTAYKEACLRTVQSIVFRYSALRYVFLNIDFIPTDSIEIFGINVKWLPAIDPQLVKLQTKTTNMSTSFEWELLNITYCFWYHWIEKGTVGIPVLGKLMSKMVS